MCAHTGGCLAQKVVRRGVSVPSPSVIRVGDMWYSSAGLGTGDAHSGRGHSNSGWHVVCHKHLLSRLQSPVKKPVD
jgi:hypothetical protein